MFRFKLILLMTILYVESHKMPCPEVLTVNITHGVRDGKAVIVDGKRFEQDNYYIYDGTTYGCICNLGKPCFRKCCGPEEIMINRTCVSSDIKINFHKHEGTLRINSTSDHYFVHNMQCKGYRNVLKPHLMDTDQFYVQANGSLYLPYYRKNQMRDVTDYCIEVFDDEKMALNKKFSVLLCLNDEDFEEDEVSEPHAYGMIISMPFLLATFIAYALLPDRNLHMMALMFYVITLMLSYILLVIIQLSKTQFSDIVCTSIGYFCLFFFLVSFFWMNVICVDIWFAFSGLRGFSGSRKSAEKKRFLMYCGYAWGMPILHVSIVRLIDSQIGANSELKPGIGEGQCFLKRGYPELLYFYGPMAILIAINVVLFAITACKIRSVKKDTSMLKNGDSKRHSYENDKQTFNLYLKLLFAMGVNWSMEIISWAVLWQVNDAPEAIWYLTDFCNAIYGVFIFFIFVFKRSIWKLLKKRYYSFIGKPHLAHSMTMTNTTRVTTYSTTNSSYNENPHGVVTDTSTLTSQA